MDISIKDIAEILESEESKKVIELLLDEQEKNIQADVKKKTKQLENIKGIRSSLASFKDGSQKTIHDISSIMEEKEKRKKMYKKMLIIAIPLEIVEIVTFVIGILKGIWLPFFVAMAVIPICVAIMFGYWYKRVEYLYPGMPYQISAKEIRSILWKSYAKDTKANLPYLQEENLEFGSI